MGRVWWPEVPRLRAKVRGGDTAEVASWLGGDIAEGFAVIAVAVVVAVFFVLLFTVVFPIVVLGVELLLFLVIALLGIAGRLLLGHAWTIRARGPGGRELTWQAKGFAASGRVRDAAADALAVGDPDPRPAEALT